MKKSMAIGGWFGFSLGMLCGLLAGGEWPSVLLRAAGAALAASLLFRWYISLCARCVLEARSQRQAAAPTLPAEAVRPQLIR